MRSPRLSAGVVKDAAVSNQAAPANKSAITVDESKMRFDFEPQVQFVLPLINKTTRQFHAKVELQFLDNEDKVAASGVTAVVLDPGNFLNNLALGKKSPITDSPSLLGTYRLKYRVLPDVPTDFAPLEGIVQLNKIITNPYQVRISMAKTPRPGTRFPVRVRVEQPYDGHSYPGMDVTATLKLKPQDSAQPDPLPVVRHGQTDADGYALFVFDLPPGHDYSGGEVTVAVARGVLLETEAEEFEYASQPRLALTSDKPIYQPGQTVHMRVQAFGPDHYALAGAKIELQITDPENLNTFRAQLKTSKFGIVSADWPVPVNLRLGDFEIKASLERGDWYDDAEQSEKIKISRYDLPNFSVEVTPNYSYYTADRSASVKVVARYLFGEPVKQGHVRVTRLGSREWNYREQKYDTEEEENVAGELGPDGTFNAPIALKKYFGEFADNEYERFEDIRFSAYVTDASTQRTEQRRFDLRITHQPIHIYLQRVFAPVIGQPAEVYLTTSYADGTPASVEVALAALKPNAKGDFEEDAAHPLQALELGSVHTNAYGVAKVTGLRVPEDCLQNIFEGRFQPPGASAYLRFEARDNKGASGVQKEEIFLTSVLDVFRLIPAQTLYRAGDDVRVEVDSTSKSNQVILDIVGEAGSLASQVVPLTGGHGSARFPYDPRFQGELKIQAYNMSTGPNSGEGDFVPARILFPAKQGLDLGLRLAHASYRPGEEAVADFNIVTAEGKPVLGALGAVVFDKAVSERVRTDEDFGGRSFGFTDYWWNYAPSDSIAGITANDLLKWDSTSPYPEGLDLVAEVLMSQFTYYRGGENYVSISGGENYFIAPSSALSKAIQARLRVMQQILDNDYKKTSKYPFSPAALQMVLKRNGIDFDALRDPWDMPYQTAFRAENGQDILEIKTNGPDKLPNTKDDFTVVTIQRPNYLAAVLDADFKKTSEFPNSLSELKRALQKNEIDFDHYLDPWGSPYGTRFWVQQDSDVLEIRSAGPDRKLNTEDDFVVATIHRGYFWKIGNAINRVSEDYVLRTGKYIRDYPTLRDELAKEKIDLDAARDPWGNKYALDFGIAQNYFTITARSSGPDGFFTSVPKPSYDDVFLWSSRTPYFQREQAYLDAALAEYYQKTGIFPDTLEKLQPVLRAAKLSPEALADPWGRPYHFTFSKESRYTNRIQIKTYSVYPGQSRTTREAVPVTQEVELIHVMSDGPDTANKTPFSVAEFSREFTEQTSKDLAPTKPGDRTTFSAGAGAIGGTVTDQSGAVIPGATVSARQLETGVSSETTTDSNGRYLVRHLRSGSYELHFKSLGFQERVVARVPVRSSSVTMVDVVLDVGAATQMVMVRAEAPGVMTESSEIVAVSTERKQAMQRKQGSELQLFTPRVREYFPETLLWAPEAVTDENGHLQLRFKLADNITTWTMSVVASTLDGQTGLAQQEIRAFQPFFVEHDPPKILTLGDRISLPVVLRNYMPEPQAMTVQMKPEKWFSLLAPPLQKITIPAGGSVGAIFPFRAEAAIKDGKQRVTAANSQTGDAIERAVAVHPDGEEVFQASTDILGGERSEMAFDISEHAIPGSTEAVLKIYPNLMAHVLESVKGIVVRPNGCGEQVSSTGLANLRALRVLQKAGQDDPDAPGNPNAALARHARQNVQEAYDKLLSYRASDGGVTYWGYGDSDLAVTAHTLRFLNDARAWITVDEQFIKQAREFIAKQQRNDGSWMSKRWPDYKSKPDATLTAYLVRVLATSEPASKDAGQKTADTTVEKGLHFLEDRIDEWKESYLVANYALAAIATGRADFQQKARRELLGMAHDEGSATYWNVELNCTPFYGWGAAGRYETTALAVQALSMLPQAADTDGQAARQSRRGLLFLLQHKDPYGVWYSTAATVNVLDAIIASIPPGKIPGETSSATVLLNGKPAATVRIPAPGEVTGPVLVDLPPSILAGANKIEIRRAQDASALMTQVVAVNYIPWSFSAATKDVNLKLGETRALRLGVSFDHTAINEGETVRCTVKAERIGFEGYGMMLAEVGLPPGVDVDRASLDAAMSEHGYEVNHYDVLPDRVVLYIWPRAGGVEFSFTFRPRLKMQASTAPSLLYDYYNPDARSLVQPVKFLVQ